MNGNSPIVEGYLRTRRIKTSNLSSSLKKVTSNLEVPSEQKMSVNEIPSTNMGVYSLRINRSKNPNVVNMDKYMRADFNIDNITDDDIKVLDIEINKALKNIDYINGLEDNKEWIKFFKDYNENLEGTMQDKFKAKLILHSQLQQFLTLFNTPEKIAHNNRLYFFNEEVAQNTYRACKETPENFLSTYKKEYSNMLFQGCDNLEIYSDNQEEKIGTLYFIEGKDQQGNIEKKQIRRLQNKAGVGWCTRFAKNAMENIGKGTLIFDSKNGLGANMRMSSIPPADGIQEFYNIDMILDKKNGCPNYSDYTPLINILKSMNKAQMKYIITGGMKNIGGNFNETFKAIEDKYNILIDDLEPPIEYTNIIVENFNSLIQIPIKEYKYNDIDNIIKAYHYATTIKSITKFNKDIDKTDAIQEINTKSYFNFLKNSFNQLAENADTNYIILDKIYTDLVEIKTTEDITDIKSKFKEIEQQYNDKIQKEKDEELRIKQEKEQQAKEAAELARQERLRKEKEKLDDFINNLATIEKQTEPLIFRDSIDFNAPNLEEAKTLSFTNCHEFNAPKLKSASTLRFTNFKQQDLIIPEQLRLKNELFIKSDNTEDNSLKNITINMKNDGNSKTIYSFNIEKPNTTISMSNLTKINQLRLTEETILNSSIIIPNLEKCEVLQLRINSDYLDYTSTSSLVNEKKELFQKIINILDKVKTIKIIGSDESEQYIKGNDLKKILIQN